MVNRKTNAVKQAAADWQVPQDAHEADGEVALIGQAQRKRQQLETQMNHRLAGLKAHYEELAAPLKAEIEGRAKALQSWCEANRRTLLTRGAKFHRFAAGEVSWRTRPPSVRIRSKAAVLALLKAAGLARFIRTKEEIDKEAMLADTKAAVGVKGVTIGSSGEDFVIKPFETELEEVV